MRLPELSSAEWVAIGLVALGAAVAVWAGPNLGIAAIGAVTAVGAAVWLAGMGLSERRRRKLPRLEAIDGHRMVGLSAALRSGEIGRSEVLATVRGLSRELRGRDLPPMSLQEESRLLDAPPKTFRSWLQEQVDLLEQET